uniref:Nucleoporin Nup133/Nup155-like C-terminal domain-containing protein n=1 Tax=Acrobeloides nanus TaxID=290746 RepID=A0A914EPN9_9BILA
MSDLELCIDSVECEYPGFVTECFSFSNERFNLSARINIDGFCSLLFNKQLFVWNCAQQDRSKLPKCYRLPVPSTGLSYDDSSICFYKRDGQKLPGVLVISPEGTIRHWPEIGDAYKDQVVELNSEVAFSIVHIESTDYVHRFLLSTTTSSFFVIEILNSASERPNQLTWFNLDLNKKRAFTRRMSVLLWGSPITEKLNKTLILPTPINDIELVCIYSDSLHFYSIKKSSTIGEVNVCDAAYIHFSSELKSDVSFLKKNYQISILDSVLFNDGVLFLMAMVNSLDDELSLALGFISMGNLNARKELDKFNIFDCSTIKIDKDTLSRTTLHAPTANDYCVLIFTKDVVAVFNPLSEDKSQPYITPFDDELLGSGVYESQCYIILKNIGVSTIRILPRDYDLSFWTKFHSHLEPIEEFPKDNKSLLKKSFAAFCSKNLKLAESPVKSLLSGIIDGLSDLIINFVKQILDDAPMNDPRWNPDNKTNLDETISRDRSSLMLLRDQLIDKLAFYKMYIIFLNHFDITSKLSSSMPTFENRSAKAMLVEFGEKLHCMLFFVELIIGYSLPFIEDLVRKIARICAARSSSAINTQLSDYDHFCKEITRVDQFILSITNSESDEFAKNAGNMIMKKEMIMQLSAFFVTIINAITRVREEAWSIKLDENASTWLNHPPFLNNFIRHLTLTLDLLSTGKLDKESYASILEQNVYIARFVLGEQNRWQRDNSSIINRFYDLGEKALAVSLAEEFLDFTTLIRHCYESRSENEQRNLLEHYKKQFAKNDFDLFLYEYYRKKGMVSHLLEEKGGRVENFLSSYENINWIKNISNGEYDKARDILKAMSYESIDASKKQSLLSLGKLAAICSGKQDPIEMSELNHGLRLLIHQKKISPVIQRRINPQNRPLNVDEIVNADLQEETLEGYLKALLVAAVLLESPQSDPQRNSASLEDIKERIWHSALSKDNWSTFPVNESFEQNADESFFANLLGRFIELAIPKRIKKELIPEANTIFESFVASQRGINSESRKLVRHFLGTTIEASQRVLENIEA